MSARPPPDDPAYGSRRWRLWWTGLRDRLRGERARANARWGRLRPPPGRGALIWLKAGASAESVRLGAELAAAIRYARLDVRLVLSFERAHPAIVRPRFERQRGMGYGYGPCDAPRAARRALERLDPLGLILVDTPPRTHLLRRATETVPHLVAFNTPPCVGVGVEAAYPVDEPQAAAWRERGAASYLAPAADPLALLVEAQIQPTVRSLAQAGRHTLMLWWAHGLGPGEARALVVRWRESALAADGVLFLSPEEGAAPTGGLAGAADELPISQWNRGGLEPGTVVVIDDARWLGAVAGACQGGYLAAAARPTLWQALAVGLPLTLGRAAAERYAHALRALPGLVTAGNVDEVLADWADYRADAGRTRAAADAARRLFWAQRRQAEAIRDELLQRVYDW